MLVVDRWLSHVTHHITARPTRRISTNVYQSTNHMGRHSRRKVASANKSTEKNTSPNNGSTGKTVGSKTYMKLMGEDIEEVEESDGQEIELATKLIEESRNKPILIDITDDQNLQQQQSPIKTDQKPSDVEVTPTKRKRGRPRKTESSPIKSDVELTPRRSARAAVSEKRREKLLRLEEERQIEAKKSRASRKASGKTTIIDSSDNFSDDSEDEFKEEEESPSKKSPSKRTPKKVRIPSKRNASASPSPSTERRTKKGRPSKQENVTKKIFSIFHMDDMEMLSDQSQSSPAKDPKGSSETLNGSPNKISLNFDNKGQSKFSSTPVISGIRKRNSGEDTPTPTVVTKFIPMPVPPVDADGNIADPEFINKHLSDVATHLDQSARLTDERAFFLEGSEGYFEQHNLRFRPSSSSLALNAPQIDYEELIPYIKLSELVYKREKDALQKIHEDLYHQWCFELSQGYSLNFFGIGSKANIIMEFMQSYFMNWYQQTIQDEETPPAVMVINGYNPSTKLKTIIHDIVSLLVTPEEKKQQNLRMPKHVAEALPFLMSYLKRNTKRSSYNGIVKATLVLVIHNIDGDAFRDTRSQNYLSQLASLPNVWLIVSTDNINSSLLWDLYRFKNFNFLWHDITTYNSYTVEMSFRDVLNMGKSKKFVGSKGAEYVLTSLTPNARSLYKILLQLQVAKLEEASTSQAGRNGLRGSTNTGIKLRVLYETCVDNFIASNEINFKTMLGEFVEHKMCAVSKNPRGAEIVYVPFTFDEMERLLKSNF